MKRTRSVFGSTTFRLAAVYVCVFSLSVAAVFSIVFLLTDRFASQRIDEAITSEIAALRDIFVEGGMGALARTIQDRSTSGPSSPGVYLLVDRLGNKVAGNLSSWPRDVQQDAQWINFTIRDLRGASPASADVRAQQFFVPLQGLLLVGRDVRDLRDFRSQLTQSLYAGAGITILFGLVGGLFVSRVYLGRINNISETCRRIFQGNLSERVQSRSTDDEFGRLASQINAMLDQIQELMNGMREVSDNVAHDLRTPLTRLQGRLEEALRQMKDGTPERQAIEGALDETGSILATFRALLRIARVESTKLKDAQPVDLAEAAAAAVELYEPIAEEKGIELKANYSGDLSVSGDPQLLSQAIANLLDNALKFTPSGGKVSLDVLNQAGKVTLSVTDTGPGIPAEHHEKVFQRLFRLDQSRNTPGNGLGLSLVAAVAKAHGADVKLEDKNPGLAANLTFPAS